MDTVPSGVPVSAAVESGGVLRRNAVGPTGAVIMSAAIMGPAVSAFFNPQFSTPFSGEATPFVYLLCTVAMLIAASGIMEMAREFPSHCVTITPGTVVTELPRRTGQPRRRTRGPRPLPHRAARSQAPGAHLRGAQRHARVARPCSQHPNRAAQTDA
jgi:hypothetical protein